MKKSLILIFSFCAAALVGACGETPEESSWTINPETGLRMDFLQPLPPLPEWENNPHSQHKEDLGRLLFGDARLSGSGKAACGTCHLSMTYFQSSTPLDLPDRSFPNLAPSLHRNAPSLMNLVYAPMFRWDGSHVDGSLSVEDNLYEMMVLPYAEANMNLSNLPSSEGERVDIEGAQLALHQKLTDEIPEYTELFEEAFGENIQTMEPDALWRLTGKALAQFIRVAVSRNSPFDRWNAGEDGAIKEAAIRGAVLFQGKAGCVFCHNGPLLSDFQFHNISSSPPNAEGKRPDEGRYLATGDEHDRGKFLTPMLRSSAMTSPYFHDGSEVSLQQVIRRKVTEIAKLDPNHSPLITAAEALTTDEIQDLVQFLISLNGEPIPTEKLISFTESP